MDSNRKNLSAAAILLLAGCILSTSILSACGLFPGSSTSSATASTSASPSSVTATSVAPSDSATSATTQPALQLVDYFPLTPDVFLDYAGTGNEYVPMTAWVEFVRDDTVQLSYDNGGTEIHRLYRVSGGQVRQLASLPELYVREDLSLRPVDPDGEVLIQEPLAVGTNWMVGSRKRSITGLDVAVITPAGTFSALEITTEGESNTTRQYYAPGVGLVKMTITGDIEITQELRKREVPKYRTVPMTFYYGRLTDTDIEILYKEVNVEFKTNIGIQDILIRYFRQPVNTGLPHLISDETRINSVQLDPEKGIVTIDFSPELVTQMNAGSSFEAAILRSIVNTVGHAYGVENVIITLDQKPYESGHIALGPGEHFEVNYQDMVPLA
jgi:hypothetical protein